MRPLPLALAIALAVAAPADGQERPGVFLHMGPAVPRGDVADTHGTGYDLRAGVELPLGGVVAARFTVGLANARRRDEVTLRELDQDPGLFELGGGFLDGGHRWAVSALATARISLLPPGRFLVPYLLAGGGLAQTGTADLEVWYLGDVDLHEGGSEIAPAVDLGGGVELLSGRRVALFAQGSWLALLTEGGRTEMVPLHLGMTIHLGG